MIRFLQTPGPLKKIFLGGLLTIICVLMAITLIPGGFLSGSFGFGAGEGVFAKVGSQEVSVQEVSLRSQRVAQEQRLPSQMMPLIEQRVAEQLVTQKAMLSEASRMGIRVTDEEVAQELRSALGAEVFPNGKFIGEQAYANYVGQRFEMSVPQFEQEVKQSLMMRKLQNLVAGGVTVSDAEALQQYRQENTKVKFEYAVIALDSVAKQVHPTEADLKAYFDKNQSRYANAIPEKRKADYVVIDQGKLAEKLQLTPDDLQRYYNQHREEFRVPDEVNVRHILIKTPPPGADGKVDQKAVDTARAKAQEVLDKLKAGADFATLAKKYSDDPGSKDNGGSLGWIGRGRTVPEFEKAAFSLQKGQSSGLVQSTFGFHIIHVDDKRTAHVQSLEEVKSQIEPLVRQQKAAQQSESLANAVATQARSGGGLNAAAAKNGLKVEHSPLFSRTDTLPGIGNAPQFMDAVVSAHDKNAPEMVNIPQGYAIFQVTEIKPPAKPTLEEIRSAVEQDFRQERAAALLQQKTNQLSDRARAEHDLKKAAKEVGATLKTSELVSRNGQVPDIGSLAGPASVVLSMKPGAISGPINDGRNGVVLSLLERQEPTTAEFSAAKDEVRDKLLESKRNEVLQIFANDLRQRMEKSGQIRYNKDERDRLFNQRGSLAGG